MRSTAKRRRQRVIDALFAIRRLKPPRAARYHHFFIYAGTSIRAAATIITM